MKEAQKDITSKWNVPLTVSKSFFFQPPSFSSTRDFIAVRRKFSVVFGRNVECLMIIVSHSYTICGIASHIKILLFLKAKAKMRENVHIFMFVLLLHLHVHITLRVIFKLGAFGVTTRPNNLNYQKLYTNSCAQTVKFVEMRTFRNITANMLHTKHFNAIHFPRKYSKKMRFF